MEYIKYIAVIFGVLLIIAFFVSYWQEKLIFFPDKLSSEHQFHFTNRFEELSFKADKNVKLNGLLFPSDSSKGMVFYLHGNAGSNNAWGSIAEVYLQNRYDFFVLDYRGFGKSEGRISGEKQLYKDVQLVYDSMKTKYSENKIIIIGFSIGTGPATYLASTNNPKMLILNAPYYNFPDLAHHYFKILPSFLIKYKFRTNKNIENVKCPVVIFHGDQDEIIYTGSSYKLKELFKKGDQLIILERQSHNGIDYNLQYQNELKKILQ